MTDDEIKKLVDDAAMLSAERMMICFISQQSERAAEQRKNSKRYFILAMTAIVGFWLAVASVGIADRYWHYATLEDEIEILVDKGSVYNHIEQSTESNINMEGKYGSENQENYPQGKQTEKEVSTGG